MPAPEMPKVDFEWTQTVIYNKGPLVIINNLPNNITYHQVMEGVTGLGGISSVLVRPEPASHREGAYCAAIHFHHDKAAKAYIDFFKEKPLFFMDKDDDVHQACMLYFKASTPSDDDSQSSVSGRCLELSNFPTNAVWAAIKKIGISHIVRLSFSPDASSDVGELSVELTDVVKASYIRDVWLADKSFPGFSGRDEDVSDGLCESDYPPSHIKSRHENVIPYIEPDHLEKWNIPPYNTWEPRRPSRPAETSPRATFRSTLPRIPEEDVTPRPEMTVGDETYTCENGRVYILSTRNRSVQREVRGTELRVLQAMTLGRQQWSFFWRELSLQQQIINPDTYASIVEHRRLKDEGRITCPPDCDQCGPSLRDSPTPLRAQMYTQGSDDGFMYEAFIRGDDMRIIMSVPPMVPQMGEIIRYD